MVNEKDKPEWVLAVETSSAVGSVALGRGEALLAEEEFSAGHRHGVELLPTVDRLLRSAGVEPSRIEWVFISAGPGSFTGLRVGFTFARALSQVHGSKLVAVPTCEVIVANIWDQMTGQGPGLKVAVVLDAKRKQVCAAGFEWDGVELRKILAEQAIRPNDLLSRLGRPLWMTGEGIDYHQSALEEHEVTLVAREHWRPRASKVLTLGWTLAKAGRVVAYDDLTPTYVRIPEAEEKWRAGELKHLL